MKTKVFKKGNNKGFTLVELLISLVVIALIIGLLVAFFGNPLSKSNSDSAAISVMDDMRQFCQAEAQYYDKKGTGITALSNFVSAGLFPKTGAVPTPNAHAVSVAGTAYTLDTTTFADITGKVQSTAVLTNVPDAVCKSFNRQFGSNSVNPIGDAIAAGFSASQDPQCFATGTADTNTIVKFLDKP
ncbi:type II secretion system protein [Oryzomonas rubra]|nr:type II secretion system protein [Oryzomonas rubra]